MFDYAKRRGFRSTCKGDPQGNSQMERKGIEYGHKRGLLLAQQQCNEVTIKIHRPGLLEKLFFFLSGIVVGIPIALFFESFASNLCLAIPIIASICPAVIVAPLIEEFAKVCPLFYRHGETQRSLVMLGFLIGLGFGVAEFFIYVFLLGTPFYIRIPQVIFHASSTSITAYGIATKRTWIFYLIAVMLHFFANFFTLQLSLIWAIGLIFTYGLTYLLAWRVYKVTSEKFVE
jgi:RsiW-degrading membrane proteinase PrsW (M82 family)